MIATCVNASIYNTDI